MKKHYHFDKKPHGFPKAIKLVVFTLIVLVTASVVGFNIVYRNNLLPVSASQKSILISIPPGSSVHEIGELLKNKGIIRSTWAFEWYIRSSATSDLLQAGSYNLRPSQSVQNIVMVLTQGDIAKDLFTILPGQRLDQLRNALINNGGFSEQQVDDALKPEHYSDMLALADKPAFASLEGYLYPDSYEKTATTAPKDLIRASLLEMQQYITPEFKQAMADRGLSPHEGIILASIIVQEVSSPEDMAVVAQVFLSRLEQDIALESDATAPYGAIKAGQTPSLTYDSEYNTYLYKGLPPGPIANVTKNAINAVTNPASTDYLFFVSGDDGKTYFSRTLSEHERLTELHCTQLCNR